MCSPRSVLVVGGGPAGASAAIQLARYGHAVTVVDRARFPRARVGESLPPKIEGLLAILGVGEAVAQAGFSRMRGTLVETGRGQVFHEFDPEVGRRGYQVERARFDTLLLDAARAAGAHVLEGTAALAPIESDGRVRGVRVSDAEKTRGIEAAWVLDASGAAAWGGRAFGLRRREVLRTVALTGYWAESRLPDGHEPTATLFEMLPEGWLWSVLRQDGLRNVTLGVDPTTLKGEGVAPEALYVDRVRRSRLVAPLVIEARLQGKVVAHDATWQQVERFARPGLLHVGDAAAVIDPLTSQGVYKAIQSGIIAATVVNTALLRPEDEGMALDYYEASQARFAQNYADLSRSFYRASPFAGSPFWAERIRAEALGPDELGEARIAGRTARREQFRAEVEAHGGQQVHLRAREGLSVQTRPVAAGAFIERREVLVFGDEVIDTPRVDVQVLLRMLDGRAMADVFDGYAAWVGEGPSRALGRRLMVALSALASSDALDVALRRSG